VKDTGTRDVLGVELFRDRSRASTCSLFGVLRRLDWSTDIEETALF
jgi:hypothetical protein